MKSEFLVRDDNLPRQARDKRRTLKQRRAFPAALESNVSKAFHWGFDDRWVLRRNALMCCVLKILSCLTICQDRLGPNMLIITKEDWTQTQRARIRLSNEHGLGADNAPPPCLNINATKYY